MEKHDATLQKLVEQALPGHVVRGVQPLRDDPHADLTSGKALGYGAPQLLTVEGPRGRRKLVLHVSRSNGFGHNRRSDRAAMQIEAYSTFNSLPGHVKALDYGAFNPHGTAVSLRRLGEYYLLTEYAEGEIYAERLRALSSRGTPSPGDIEDCRMLAAYLADLHQPASPPSDQDAETLYRRSVRDLLGSGEGIFGQSDAYDFGQHPELEDKVRTIEELSLSYRWQLRGRTQRLSRVHGDFHPFNILFQPRSGVVRVLDASQGTWGDPAMDVTALCINYLFFGAADNATATRATLPLFREFIESYQRLRNDAELMHVAPPFFAFRALVIACPQWYPHVEKELRLRLLDTAITALRQQELSIATAENF